MQSSLLNQLNLILYNIIRHPIMHESLHVYETALAAIDTVAIYIYIYIGLYYHSYNSTSLISARIY